MPELLAAFRGPVSCRRAPGALTLSLSGMSSAPGAASTTLAFSGADPRDLPDTLEDVRVEDLGAGEYRVASAAGSWRIAASAVHVHADAGAAFYRALPPRPVPWRKRLFWRAVLWLAASRAGLAALRMRRR